MKVHLPLLIASLAAACTSGHELDASGPVESSAISLDGWRTERISLPPEFAPGLPRGQEQLLFAPGMFTAGAEDFWTYVFTLDLQEGDIDAGRMSELLEIYYDGLLQAVAGDRGQGSSGDIAGENTAGENIAGEDFAQVRLTQVAPDQYGARITLIDTFVTMQPLIVNLKIRVKLSEAGRTVLHVRASPLPDSHPIWTTLEAALASID